MSWQARDRTLARMRHAPPQTSVSTEPRRSQREYQRTRTRAALVQSARTVIASGSVVTMRAISDEAGVSEATAYRYFPDLLAIMGEGFIGVWPSADITLPTIETCPDPVERIVIAVERFARNVLEIQGAVRTMIALTVARPDGARARPGHRFGMIDAALAPLAGRAPARVAQLRNDLSIVISAEALFNLTDLNKLSADEAIGSMKATATSLVKQALLDLDA